MDQGYKNYLHIAIIIALLVFSYAALSYVRTYGDALDPTLRRSFSVSAEGKSVAVPDIAQFSFSVITEGGTDLTALQKTNSEKINKINKFIKLNGVDDKDIKTEGYSVQPRYQSYDCGVVPLSLPTREIPPFGIEGGGVNGSSGASADTATSPIEDYYPPYYKKRPCPPQEIVGYSIHQSVSITVRDFEKIGTLLSGVVENGANSVSQLFFTLDDPTKPQNEARAEAIAKAQKKARDIARAGGFRLGRLLSISEGGYPIPYQRFYGTEAAFGKGGDSISPATPDIEPGSQDVIINVTLVYEIR